MIKRGDFKIDIWTESGCVGSGLHECTCVCALSRLMSGGLNYVNYGGQCRQAGRRQWLGNKETYIAIDKDVDERNKTRAGGTCLRVEIMCE